MVAETILNQLGGNRFVVFTGCRDLLESDDSLTMSLPRNSSKANRLEVRYDGSTDTYSMRFYKHTNASYSMNRYIKTGNGWKDASDKDIQTFAIVYCDELLRIFTDVTGMIVPNHLTINNQKIF